MLSQDVFALDVGYGDTKLAWQRSQGGVVQSSFCSVAVPVSGDGVSLDADHLVRGADKASRVNVGGTVYEVGREADLTAGSESFILHKGYIQTDEYLAFVRAALASCVGYSIQLLVTGLPVAQYAALRGELRDRIIGKHSLDLKGDAVVEVKDVLVVPQPLGGLRDYQHERRGAIPLNKQNVLIADMGSGTFDWMFSRRMRAVPERSGSCRVGMARVFHELRKSLLSTYKAAPAERDIADAVIAGDTQVFVAGRAVSLKEHLDSAARTVARRVVRELQTSLDTTEDIDRVVLVGGGAALMRPFIADIFSATGTPVECLPYPAFANVRGYLRVGLDQLRGPVAGVRRG